jgi:hypothetical protein
LLDEISGTRPLPVIVIQRVSRIVAVVTDRFRLCRVADVTIVTLLDEAGSG